MRESGRRVSVPRRYQSVFVSGLLLVLATIFRIELHAQSPSQTTVVVSASSASTVFGQAVTFTATVSVVPPGSGTPTGTVTFKVDGVTSSTVALSGGAAGLSVSNLTVGPHSITAVYNGSSSYATSTSSALTHTVNKAGTTTSVGSSVNPSVVGQQVTFTATVGVVAPGSGTPTGTVTFTVDGVPQTPIALSSGQAALSRSFSIGPHSIAAAYNGDSSFNTSTSSTLTQTVNKAGTTTSVGSSVNPSVVGQQVTFTATVGVVAPGSGTPTGTVTFTVDGVPQTPIALSSGQAALSRSFSIGPHSIAAAYNGDSSFNTSTSSTLTQTVDAASTTTTVSASANPVGLGQTVTFTAIVSVVAPAAGTPTGTVSFKDGAAKIATVSPSGGVATFATSSLSLGTHSITAVFNGGGSFTTSTSAALDVQVSLMAPTNFAATAVSTSQVNLTWDAAGSGTTYDVFRVLSGGSLQHLGSSAGLSHSHTGLTGGTTYVYAVRATNGSTVGPMSTPDLATTVLFTDDPLVAGVTTIKAVHVNELRTAIDAVRSAAGLGGAVYSDAIASGEPIRTADITALRTALDAARAELGVPALTYTDTPLNAGTTIKAAHVHELRNGVK